MNFMGNTRYLGDVWGIQFIVRNVTLKVVIMEYSTIHTDVMKIGEMGEHFNRPWTSITISAIYPQKPTPMNVQSSSSLALD
jgi:hypothetical protein